MSLGYKLDTWKEVYNATTRCFPFSHQSISFLTDNLSNVQHCSNQE